jgi:hypothetical protein
VNCFGLGSFVVIYIVHACCGLLDGGKLANKDTCCKHCCRVSAIVIYVCRNCKNLKDMQDFARFISEMIEYQ